MTTGTKIALAVIVLMVGLLVVYYGGGAIFGGGDQVDASTESPPGDLSGTGHAARRESANDADGTGDRTELADNTIPSRPVDPLQQGMAGGALDQGALATDSPHRQAFVPLDNRLTELDRPRAGATDSGPAVVLPESANRALLTSNQPAAISERLSGVRPANGTVPNLALPPITSEYTVQPGDTLSSIAESWFGDAAHWDLIARANPFDDPNRLKVGQKLRMPARDTARIASLPPPQNQPAGPGQYIVQSGDTLASIARAYYSDAGLWEVVFNANKSIIGANPDRLKVGMRLTIPPAPKPAR